MSIHKTSLKAYRTCRSSSLSPVHNIAHSAAMFEFKVYDVLYCFVSLAVATVHLDIFKCGLVLYSNLGICRK